MGNGGGGDGSLSIEPLSLQEKVQHRGHCPDEKSLGRWVGQEESGGERSFVLGVSRWDGREAGGKAQYPALVQPHMRPPAALRLFSLPRVPLKDLLSLC